MATASLPLTFTGRMYTTEFRYELLRQIRNKMYTFSVLGFPVMFYLLFGVVNRHATLDGFSMSKYLVAAYSVFGLMGSALFGVGVSMAIERGQGWLDLKRASPLPAAALLCAKCGSAICFAIFSSCLLMLCGILVAGVHMTIVEGLRLLAIVAVGTIPFAALGLCISFLLSSTAAPGMMNLIYLPMSFCSGLWIPIAFLPKWVQRVAEIMPSYHLAELAFGAFGFHEATPHTFTHWMVLAAETALFLALAGFLYQRSNSRG